MLVLGPIFTDAQSRNTGPSRVVVRFSEQTIVLPRVDSLELTNILPGLITRKWQRQQFNILIGVYVARAIDSLKAGNAAAAEQIIYGEALPMLSRYGDPYNMYHCFMTLGKSFASQKKYTQSKWFLLQAAGTAEKLNYRPGQLFSLMELAEVKTALGDFSLALSDYRKAARLATAMKFNETLARISRNIRHLSEAVATDVVDQALAAAKSPR